MVAMVLSIPAANNPLLDTTGEDCAAGHQAKCGFSWGRPVPGRRRVPVRCDRHGAVLFHRECLLRGGSGRGSDPTIERECAAGSLAGATGTVEIDGVAIANLSNYFVDPLTGATFSLTLPTGNIFGAPAGIYEPAAAGGLYLLLAPLPPGEHTIHFAGSLDDGQPWT